MRQILLLILLFFAGSWIAQAAARSTRRRTGRGAGYDGTPGAGGAGSGRPNGDARALPEPMVRCAECGVRRRATPSPRAVNTSAAPSTRSSRRAVERSRRTMSDARLLSVDAHGWVREARHAPSPNFEVRPAGAVPTLVVVHNISLPPGEFGGDAIEALFLNRLDCDAHPYYQSHLRDVRVSAHFLIRRNGELVQFVSCDERAWHASEFFGRARCNDFSIGIERGRRAVRRRAVRDARRALPRARGTLPGRRIRGALGRRAGPQDRHFDWQRFASDAGFPPNTFLSVSTDRRVLRARNFSDQCLVASEPARGGGDVNTSIANYPFDVLRMSTILGAS